MRSIFAFIGICLSLSSIAQKISSVNKADSLIALSEYEDARTVIEKQLSAKNDEQQIILLKNKKIEILILQGNLDAAERELKSIEPLKNDFIDAITLTNYGFFYLNKGRYDLAQEKLLAAQDKFQQSQKINTKEGARCLSVLGSLYGATRKYNQAEESQQVAMQIRERLFGSESEEVAASYNDLGTLYLETDPDRALDLFEKADNTYKKIHGTNHPKIAISNTNMGFAYQKLELYGDAVNDFEEANKIWESIYPNGHPNQALVLSFLGQTYRKMKDPKTAEAFFTKSLQIYQKSYGEKHPDISKIFIELGLLHLEAANYDAALSSFQKSIIANAPSFHSEDIKLNPSYKDNYSGIGMLYSLRYKSESLESRYAGKTLKREDLKLALSCLHTCDSLIDEIRYQSTDESDKLALGELANEVYEDGVRISYSLSEMTMQNSTYKELSYYFAEKSKSAVLQESIADSQAKSFAGIPSTLLDEEKNLKAEIALINQKLALKPEAKTESILREKLFQLTTRYNSFIKNLEKDYPNYFNLKFNRVTPSLSQTQLLLDKNTCVISYFIAEKNSRIYQFIITQNKFTINNLSLPLNIDRTLKGFTNSLFYSNFDIYKKTSSELTKKLIPALPHRISSLIIIPSGKLSTLPFEALGRKNKKKNTFSEANYLINRFSIQYDFSVSLLSQKGSKPESGDKKNIFICAPVNFSDESGLGALPGSETEANMIAAIFNDAAKIAKLQDASEKNIKNTNLSDYTYLHFATHGIVDEEHPELSCIFLNSTQDEDGNLYAGEIYNLSLNADLAVLSACQTGLGKISKGEGVIGLSRALTFAGAKNLIVSFWSVSDESTTMLMTDFYKEIQSAPGINFTEALRKSKLNLLKDNRYASPYYWAPFVLIGD